MCKLLCDQGYHHVFGWEQDVAISVNSIAEATLVVKSNVSTLNATYFYGVCALDYACMCMYVDIYVNSIAEATLVVKSNVRTRFPACHA
jgi:hypothetical protein